MLHGEKTVNQINQTVGDKLQWLEKRLFEVGGVDAQKSPFKAKHYDKQKPWASRAP